MKNLIEENYFIKVEELVEKENYISFLNNGEYYYFIKTGLTQEELLNISILIKAIVSPLLSHKLILNNKGDLLTNGYVLIKIEGILNEEFGVEDIIKFNDVVIDLKQIKDYRLVMWNIMWQERLDFFEYQIREIGKDKEIILNSFSYYLGLAENACTYVDKVIKMIPNQDVGGVLCHRRLYYPNYKLNFLNPLNYTIDIQVRDIAEYLKNKFFVTGEKEVMIDIDNYFSKVKLNNYLYQMFYARMLYPSYYFDAYESVMVDGVKEDVLIKYIEKIGEYEHLLNSIKKYLNKYVQIFEINWLNHS